MILATLVDLLECLAAGVQQAGVLAYSEGCSFSCIWRQGHWQQVYFTHSSCMMLRACPSSWSTPPDDAQAMGFDLFSEWLTQRQLWQGWPRAGLFSDLRVLATDSSVVS